MCRCNVYEQEQELTCSIAQVTNKAFSPPAPNFGVPEHHRHGSGYSTLGHGSVLLLKLGGKVGSGYRGWKPKRCPCWAVCHTACVSQQLHVWKPWAIAAWIFVGFWDETSVRFGKSHYGSSRWQAWGFASSSSHTSRVVHIRIIGARIGVESLHKSHTS